MNEETKQFITKHFESNFLDGDVMPCKAVTFTAYGALDVAEYFYELAVEAERERIVEEVKHEMIYVGDETRCRTCKEHVASGDCDCTGINKGLQIAINLIQIK